MRALIVYYSRTGKTELVAKEIARVLNGEVRKVEEVKKRRGFFGYISAVRSARRGECGEIKPMDFNLDDYDLIFIGTPVWARKPTPAINAFISKADFRDKMVVLFVTMAMRGGENAIKILSNLIESKGGKVIDSFVIRTGGVKEEKIIGEGNKIGRKYEG